MPGAPITSEVQLNQEKAAKAQRIRDAIDANDKYIAKFTARGWGSDPRVAAAQARLDRYRPALAAIEGQNWQDPTKMYKMGDWTGKQTEWDPKINAYKNLRTTFTPTVAPSNWSGFGWGTNKFGNSAADMAANWEEALAYIDAKKQTPWGMNNSALDTQRGQLQSKLDAYRARQPVGGLAAVSAGTPQGMPSMDGSARPRNETDNLPKDQQPLW